MRNVIFSGCTVVSLAIAGAASGAVYDLAADFSFASNPNGQWSYNEGANPLPYQADWLNGQPAFAMNPWPIVPFIPVIFQAISDQEDWLTGDVVFHSWDWSSGGTLGPANITWTAPGNGVIDISGNTWLARSLGRYNDVSLLLNGVPLDAITLFDGDAYDRANPYAFQGALTNLAVTAGDVVMLRVDYNADGVFGEFAGLNLTINYVPSPGAAGLFALAAFSARRKRS